MLSAGEVVMGGISTIVVSGKQIVLLAVAGLLSVSGAIAIGILLFGDFGQTEGRVLATTGLLAAYGLLALPAAMLVDRGRLPALAVLVLALALAGASLAVSAVWTSSPPDALGNAVGTVTASLVASAQVSALVLRRPERDRTLIRWLFAMSSVLAVVVAAMFTLLLWAEIESERYGRVLAAVVVLDLLAVALQPTLSRARPKATVIPLQLLLESDEIRDIEVLAPDLAAAAAKAIRQIEREGHHVVRLEVADMRGRSSDD
jgi:hypothetical protein